MQIKVKNQYTGIMFIADVNDDWIHMLTMRDQIKPHIKNVIAVEPGTGNSGKNLEYECEYDGYAVEWEHFAAIGNEAQ